MLFGFPAGGEALVAAMEPVLCGPGLGNDDGRCAALTLPEGIADEGMVAVMPGGFDEHAPQVGVAGFGDGAASLFVAAGMLRGDEPDEGHRAWGRGEAPWVAEFGSDGKGGQIVDAAKAAEANDARPQRLKLE